MKIKKIYLKTFGCAFNQADSDVIRGILKQYIFINNPEKADLIIVNSCGVKQKTESRVLSFVNKYKDKVILGGCLPRMKKIKDIPCFDNNSILQLPKIIKNKKSILSNKKESKINKLKIRNSNKAIIQIAEGCLGKCAYCSVKLARGNLKSYNINQILKEFKLFLKQGYKIFYLTSQDNGCYGLDINTNLPKLLKEILKLKENFKIRIGMMNPYYAKLYLNELIQIYKDKRILPFLHIPIQSGSNKLLKEMNRKGNIQNFKKVIKEFRKDIPNINISTDIITGYPLETDEDFKLTLNLIKEIKPEVLNISKFGPRPNTKAKLLKQLPSEIIKQRSIALTNLFRSFS